MMEIMMEIVNKIKKETENMNTLEKAEYFNKLNSMLSKLSPFTEPVANVSWIPLEKIHFNAYNPNSQTDISFNLLYESIKTDGYTMPAVVFDMGNGEYEVIDGMHRSLVNKTKKDINERTHNHMPVVIIKKDLDERMGSTIRHNRARGNHSLKSMSDIVVSLINSGWEDEKICEKLGMDREEVLRMKQISSLKEAFMNHEFSKSWSEFEVKNYPEEIGKTKNVSKKAKS